MVTVQSRSAKKQLQATFEYIQSDSIQSAKRVRDEIIDFSIKLASKPDIYPLDKYKLNNDGTYRAFEIDPYGYLIEFLKMQ